MLFASFPYKFLLREIYDLIICSLSTRLKQNFLSHSYPTYKVFIFCLFLLWRRDSQFPIDANDTKMVMLREENILEEYLVTQGFVDTLAGWPLTRAEW